MESIDEKTEMSGQDYNDAIAFLYSQLPMFSRVGQAAYKPGLDTSLNIDRHFGSPHKRFKSIHIAGTNGKGSTSHMIASILQAQGYKTALYTSPHLIDFRERMRVNGQMIPRQKVVDFVNRWKCSGCDLHPSFFELTMMMAFDWFANENVDYAVIEVGMGGRLDSTNIITPEVCVITNISADHTQFLGESLTQIAEEKAGIMKKGIPVVVGEAEGEIRNVFERKSLQTGAPTRFAEDNERLRSVSEGTLGGWLCSSREGDFLLPLSGDYQKKNVNTVLNAIDAMRDSGIVISDKSVVSGLENVIRTTGLSGRWSVIRESPLVIADTGHNIAGISYNMKQLHRVAARHPEGKIRIVIGFVADKAIGKILELLPRDAIYYITNADIPRALPAAQLYDRFKEAGLDGCIFHKVSEAYHAALNDSGIDDVIYIGGSTFVVADFLASLS